MSVKELSLVESNEVQKEFPYVHDPRNACCVVALTNPDEHGFRAYQCGRPKGHLGRHIAYGVAYQGLNVPVATWAPRRLR